MADPYITLVVGPLIGLLVAVLVFESRTSRIPNAVTFPAAAYFVAASSLLGPGPWWQYLLASFTAVAVTLVILRGATGTVKLIGAVSGALGFRAVLLVMAVFVLALISAMLVTNRPRRVPSSAFVLTGCLAAVGYSVNINAQSPIGSALAGACVVFVLTTFVCARFGSEGDAIEPVESARSASLKGS
jgi:hypothetical protein